MKQYRLNYFLEIFRTGKELPPGDAEIFFDLLLAEQNEDLLAEIFIEWNKKGTTENEIFALARIMKKRCVKVSTKHETFVDAVGTGGSRRKTFNISTAAAFVIAGAGVPVAKHGNRAATSDSGSADALSALGVNSSVEAARAEICLDKIGICFMFAPKFHSLSPVLAKVRRGLGFPTIFNNLGPLCNPANAPHQLIGVYKKDLVEKTANVLARLGTKKSWIVHGCDGLDEITLDGKTSVAEICGNKVKTFEISPKDFGLKSSKLNNLSRSSPEESAKIITEILEGKSKKETADHLVLINAAAAIFLCGFAEDFVEAAKLARQSLESGAARQKLNELISETNK